MIPLQLPRTLPTAPVIFFTLYRNSKGSSENYPQCIHMVFTGYQQAFYCLSTRLCEYLLIPIHRLIKNLLAGPVRNRFSVIQRVRRKSGPQLIHCGLRVVPSNVVVVLNNSNRPFAAAAAVRASNAVTCSCVMGLKVRAASTA